MSKISATKRVIEILKELNDGKLLCIENLAYAYDTSTRSIRRDFELIKEIFGEIIISPSKGCYQVITKTLLENTLTSTELYTLKNILQLSEKSSLTLSNSMDDNIKSSILKDNIDSVYKFNHKPYEDIYTHKNKFKTLEHAIKYRKEIKIVYNNDNRVNVFYLKAHKIIFISENFYLVSSSAKFDYILSRIALIENIEFTGNEFKYNHDLLEFTDYMQSPWAVYRNDWKNKLIDIVIQIPDKQAKYFKLKKFMPSQEIINEDENGNIQVKYRVTSPNELTGLIKQWIPHVKVLEPKSLVGQFKKIAERYYNINQ